MQRIKHSDFVLRPEQKAAGFFLSCCCAADSDCQIHMREIGTSEEIRQQAIETRVYRKQPLSADVLSLTLKTPRSQPLQFLAGQHVTLIVNDELSRNKSIASCPCEGHRVEFHVKHRSSDPFSRYIFDRLQKNDRVRLEGPWGNFILDDESSRPLIFIAYDTGFASIKSLLEQVIALELPQSVSIYWLVTPNNTPYLVNYCRSIEDALDNFSFYPIAMRESSDWCLGEVLGKIVDQTAEINQADVYITVPDGLKETVRAVLMRTGVSVDQWRIDTLVRL